MPKYFSLRRLLPDIRYNRIEEIDLSDLELNDYTKPPIHKHLAQFDKRVLSLAQLHDGTIAVGTVDGQITIWKIHRDGAGRINEQQIDGKNSIAHTDKPKVDYGVDTQSIVELADGSDILVTSVNGGYVWLWDRRDRNRLIAKFGQPGEYKHTVRLMALTDGSLLGITLDGHIYHWDTSNLRQRDDFQRPEIELVSTYIPPVRTNFYQATLFDDAKTVAVSASRDERAEGTLLFYDWEGKCMLNEYDVKYHQGGYGMAALADGRMAFSPNEARTIDFWDTSSRQINQSIPLQDTHLTGVLFTLQDGRLVRGNDVGLMQFFDIYQDLRLLGMVGGQDPQHTSGFNYNCIVDTEDGTIVSASFWDNSVRAWSFPKRGLQFDDLRPVLMHLKDNQSVRKLSLNGIQLNDANVAELINCLRSNRFLQALDIRNTGINEQQLALIMKAAAQHPLLSVVDYEDHLTLRASIKEEEIKSAFDEKQIKDLAANTLKGITISDTSNLFDNWRLVLALKRNKSLCLVVLRQENIINTSEFARILLALMDSRQLERLVIHSEWIWDKKLINSFSQFLQKQKHLAILQLVYPQMGDRMMKTIAVALASNIALIKLECPEKGKITEKGMMTLIASFYLNTKLRHVKLGNVFPKLNLEKLLAIKTEADQKFSEITEERFKFFDKALEASQFSKETLAVITQLRKSLQDLSDVSADVAGIERAVPASSGFRSFFAPSSMRTPGGPAVVEEKEAPISDRRMGNPGSS